MNDYVDTVPHPGSAEARQLGCYCQDSAHGCYVTVGCPVHAPMPDFSKIVVTSIDE